MGTTDHLLVDRCVLEGVKEHTGIFPWYIMITKRRVTTWSIRGEIWLLCGSVSKRGVEPDTHIEVDVENQTYIQEWEGFVEEPSDTVQEGVSTRRQLVTSWLLFT